MTVAGGDFVASRKMFDESESLLKMMLPIGSSLFIRLFKAGKDYPTECRKTREDLDIKISRAINEWKK